jgi:polyphosphate kinase 2 (PPK2 family)
MLELIDLKQRLSHARYDSQRELLQNELHLLCYQTYKQKRPVVIVFEGWDAAGKGGTIKRLTERIDPRDLPRRLAGSLPMARPLVHRGREGVR